MMVYFYKKNERNQNQMVKQANLDSVPRKGDKVILYHAIHTVKDVCYDVNNNKVNIQI